MISIDLKKHNNQQWAETITTAYFLIYLPVAELCSIEGTKISCTRISNEVKDQPLQVRKYKST